MFFRSHLVVKGVFGCDTETRREVRCGESRAEVRLSSAGQDPRDARSALQPRPSLLGLRGPSGARPVPPIPRLASPLPDRMRLVVTARRNEECEDVWLSDVDGKLAAHLSELNVDDEEVDQEEVGLNVT